MQAHKKINTSAKIAGGLFLLATASGAAAAAISLPLEAAPDFLAQFNAQSQMVNLSAFLQMLMAFSCAGIGLALYPIIKAYAENLALPVAGFRLLESATQILIAASAIFTLALSQASENITNVGRIETVARSLLVTGGWLADGPMLLAWCTAAMIYYAVFYRHQLVPRWLSTWGLVGIVLTVTFSLITSLGFQSEISWLPFAFNIPIALQEMVFAIWLIIRGVNRTEEMTRRRPAKTPV